MVSFWAKGYCVNTVEVDAEMIRQYVIYQEKSERNIKLYFMSIKQIMVITLASHLRGLVQCALPGQIKPRSKDVDFCFVVRSYCI